MKRIAKPAGAYNIVVEEVEVPVVATTEILIRAECSLISRGSEIWRRYVREEAIDHRAMGYSLVGRVAEVGAEVEEFKTGDLVAALAPHAEYVAVEVVASQHRPAAVRLPAGLAPEAGTFWPLGASSVLWMWETEAGPDDVMVIQGQGLVGSGCMQAAKAQGAGRVIGIDALPLRCELAHELGADAVIDASAGDSVAQVLELTGRERVPTSWSKPWAGGPERRLLPRRRTCSSAAASCRCWGYTKTNLCRSTQKKSWVSAS